MAALAHQAGFCFEEGGRWCPFAPATDLQLQQACAAGHPRTTFHFRGTPCTFGVVFLCFYLCCSCARVCACFYNLL